ncbi:MAG: chlorite dismutase family protein [Verrucomicrobia bacterium]|nr:chlorite dismutase family protein [Verrucomicrobiota bacterium]
MHANTVPSRKHFLPTTLLLAGLSAGLGAPQLAAQTPSKPGAPAATSRAELEATGRAPARVVRLTGRVLDAETGQALAARVYLEAADGRWEYVESLAPGGAAVRYDKAARANPNSIERHTSVSAHPFTAELPPGRYRLLVERGKEYFPATNSVVLDAEPVEVRVPLRRWIDLAARGWYSGDTHVHRTFEELPTVMLAEDLNVAFPLSYWVTRAFTAPSAGDKNLGGVVPSALVEVDRTHVFWPRNTEYEIFSTGGRSHTLGAVFVLGHTSVFTQGVPPLRTVAERAQAEGALLDLDKHNWPWTMALPPVMGVQLYELANNHLWRTEFAFTNWGTPAPPHLNPPYGGQSADERGWIHYTLGNYYALLNAGFPLRPTAGTANGVHPVPLGFGRVYVHLPDGFDYEAWKRGLDAGRSFVTTGPMLFAQVNGRDPGARFQAQTGATFQLTGTVVSEQPLTFAELVHNGVPVQLLRTQNRRTPAGACENTLSAELTLAESGWLAVRCWEDRPDDRVRYAHTAPWHVEIPGKPLLAPAEDRAFLVGRMRDEIQRSRALLPPEALAEYEQALAAYDQVPVRDDSAVLRANHRAPTNDADLRYWLENMVWHHRYTPAEVRAATGLTLAEVDAALERFHIGPATRPSFTGATVRVLPYPGGRHPRSGFLDGALEPQRETKLSVFTPWDDASYVVVDVPEAVWSNLGLTYLAHTHVPTVWTAQQVTLPRLEWNRRTDGALDFERLLPNGIAFGAQAVPGREGVRFELWLRNGTAQTLTGLRIQNCVMLKGAAGFNAQTSQNKLLNTPFAAVRSEDGRRWIITAWEQCDHTWANPPVPCLHSDPKFPDCAPGQTQRLRGWLWFYQGVEIEAELRRLAALAGLTV